MRSPARHRPYGDLHVPSRGVAVKRRYLAAVVVAAISATAGQVPGLAPATAATPDAWGQAASHATGDYYNAGETRLTPAAAAKLKPRWNVPLATAPCAPPATPLV